MAEPKPQKLVPVFTPGIGVRMVTPAEAPEALKGGASRFATEAEYQQGRREALYGGIGGAVGAAGYGAARGFGGMFGAPVDDILLSGASTQGFESEEDPFHGRVDRRKDATLRERLQAYEELHPLASTVGELGGMAAGAYLGGGLVGGVGGAAEALAGRGALGAVARGASEGAIYNAAKKANDLAIADEDLTAEKLVSAAGHGALIGGAAGGLLHFGTDALRGLRPSGETAPATRAVTAREAESEGGSVGNWLQKQADVKTIKSLGGSAGDLRTLERNVPGGFQRVAQDIRADIEAATGKSIGLHSRESLHEYATARVDELGEHLGGMLKKLDKSKAGIAPDVSRFAREVEKRVIAPNVIQQMDGTVIPAPGRGDVVGAAQKWLGEVKAAFGEAPPTFEAWQKARVALDKQIRFEAARVSPAQDALREIRGIMEKELEAAGEAAAQGMGSTFQAEYQAAKQLYQSLLKARDLTERGVSRALANNSVGVRALGAGLTGMLAGGPLAGAAMGFAGKVIQDRGDMLAADLLSRASGIAGVRRLAARTEHAMARDVSSLTRAANDNAPSKAAFAPPSRSLSPFGVSLTGNARKDFDKVQKAVTDAQANPGRTADRLGQRLASVSQGAPAAVTSSAIATWMRGASFLASKLPPSRLDQFSLQPHLQRPRASDAEISQFMRFAHAVDNPLIVLREAKSGTLTRDHVEAVKTVYPRLYEEMRGEVMRSLVESKSPLPYSRRIQLGILLDLPTDKTLSPEFLTAIQATYTSAEQAGAESPPPTLSRPIEVAGAQQTAMQQAVERAQ